MTIEMRARILQAEWAGCFYCKQSIVRRREYLIVITGEEAGEGGSICITYIYHNPMYILMTFRRLRDKHVHYNSVQFSRLVVSDSLRPHESRSTPGLPVHHQLPEFTQTHVHRVSDAIQPSILCRPLLLLPPIPPSISLFQWVNSLHEVAKVLEFQL